MLMEKMTISYWIEPMMKDSACWYLFSAVSEQGVIMCGLGKGDRDKARHWRELNQLAKKYFKKYLIREEREQNLNVIREVKEYLERKRQSFTLKIFAQGTDFQRRVWAELCNIPYGETRSYSDIAQKVQCPRGQRAVGMANNKNPLGIIVPCHRVIGIKGDLIGYAGGLEVKRLLLDLEKQGRLE